jgi:hypothetical protein
MTWTALQTSASRIEHFNVGQFRRMMTAGIFDEQMLESPVDVAVAPSH